MRRIKIVLTVATISMLASFQAMGYGDEQSTKTLLAKLKESKISLIDGITQTEKKYGLAISAKFELDNGALSLSVYNAKEGRAKDAEHNVLTEAAGDPVTSPWAPKLAVFADKEHLTRSATHLTLVETAKLGLVDALKVVSKRGTPYSITPAILGKAPVYEILIAGPEGKSSQTVVDAQTGAILGTR